MTKCRRCGDAKPDPDDDGNLWYLVHHYDPVLVTVNRNGNTFDEFVGSMRPSPSPKKEGKWWCCDCFQDLILHWRPSQKGQPNAQV